MSDRDLLRAVGSSVYGPLWRRSLARDLGVSGQLVSAIDCGRLSVSVDLRVRLAAWAAARRVEEAAAWRERAELLREAAHRVTSGTSPWCALHRMLYTSRGNARRPAF